MKVLASVEFCLQVIEKHGKFYAMAWDTDSVNLAFEQECASRQDAQYALADFVVNALANSKGH
jgi:hypothetical protein